MSWWKMVRGSLCASVVAASVLGYAGDAGAAGTKVMILFDRSGSMMEDPGACSPPTSGGFIFRNKAYCAFQTMLLLGQDSRLLEYFDNGSLLDGYDFYFWEFRRSLGLPADDIQLFDNPTLSGVPCGGVTGSLTQTLALPQSCLISYLTGVQNLVGPTTPTDSTGGTPLAQAYCRAMTFLQGIKTADPSTSVELILVSDGLHDVNDIPPGCSGPDSAFPNPPVTSFPALPYTVVTDSTTQFFISSSSAFSDVFLTAGSWQANMLDVAITGGVPGSGASGLGLPSVLPHTTVVNNTIPGAFQVPAAGSPVKTDINFIAHFEPPLSAMAVQAAAAPQSDPFLGFLDGLARTTGGRLIVPSNVSTNGDPFGVHALAGDIDDSGCVDTADFNLLQQAYGRKATSFDAAALAADLSLDGTVNDRDYAILKATFGSGCATTPPPIPVLANVVLGFGDKTMWTPTVPSTTLTLTGTKTEGATGLKVGGVNYREIQSKPFSTSVFGPIPSTAKLAADLYIPGPPSNPSWLGQAQLLVNCPSAGIFNQFISAVELTGKPLNRFSTISFALPANVRAAMASNPARTDFSLRLVVNSSDTGQIWDNLRVTP